MPTLTFTLRVGVWLRRITQDLGLHTNWTRPYPSRHRKTLLSLHGSYDAYQNQAYNCGSRANYWRAENRIDGVTKARGFWSGVTFRARPPCGLKQVPAKQYSTLISQNSSFENLPDNKTSYFLYEPNEESLRFSTLLAVA